MGNRISGIAWFLGQHGEETRNANGRILIELTNELIIANMQFKHRDIYKVAHEKPCCQPKSIIDSFLITKTNWKRVKDVKVRRGPKKNDHFLLKVELIVKPIKKEVKKNN